MNFEGKNYLQNFNFKSKKTIVAIIFILIALPITLFLSQTSQDIRKDASEDSANLTSLTDSLLSEGTSVNNLRNNSGRKSISRQTASVVGQSQIRKNQMLKLASSNPGEFLLNAIPESVSRGMNPIIRENVEQQVKVEGKFVALHIDDFKGEKSRDEYQVHEYDNKGELKKRYILNSAQPITAINSGTSVSVAGYSLENQLVIQGGEGENAGIEVINPNRLSSKGEQKVLAMLVNFSDDKSEKISKSTVSNILFNSPNSVKNFYLSNSNNQTTLTGDVVGYFTIPYKNTDCNNKYFNWGDAANNIANAKGINVDDYDRIIYIFSGKDCGYGGIATIGGSPSRIWISGDYEEFVYAHELGHSFGINHANGYECEESYVKDNFWDCESKEYKDPSDAMGDQYFYFNGPHKEELGWLRPDEISTINSSANVSIKALESNEPGIKLIKIPIPSSEYYYYLSFRKAVGFDTTIGQNFTQGTSVHVWQKLNDVYETSNQTNLIDINPNSNSDDFSDSPLSDGEVFDDDLNGISIEQIDHDSDGVNLEINIDKSVCRRGVPDLSIDPLSELGNPGEKKSYRLMLKNNDTLNCPPATFYFSGNPINAKYPSEWRVEFSSSDLIINPGESAEIIENVTSSDREPIGIKLIATSIYGEPRHGKAIKSNYVVYDDSNSIDLSPSPAANSKKITLYPKADSFVSSGKPTINYGKASYLETNSSKPSEIAYIKYDLSSLSGKNIKSAKLVLKSRAKSDAYQTLKNVKNGAWVENKINWKTKPKLGAAIKQFKTPTLSKTVEVDVLSVVKAKKGKELNLGIEASGVGGVGRLYSRESGEQSSPKLVITW